MSRKYAIGQAIPDPISDGLKMLNQSLAARNEREAKQREGDLDRKLREKAFEAEHGPVAVSDALIGAVPDDMKQNLQRSKSENSEAALTKGLDSSAPEAQYSIPKFDWDIIADAAKERQKARIGREDAREKIGLLKEESAGLAPGSDISITGASIKSQSPEDRELKQERANMYRTNAQAGGLMKQDVSAHQKNVQALKKDPQILARLNQYQNLDNSLSLIENSEFLTPQQIHEAQQSIRSNLGIKGSSGVGEREETYIKSLGMNAAAFKQFLTGEPAKLSKDSDLMKHIRDLARVEKENIKRQKDGRIKAVIGGNDSVYARRPELKSDLDSLINATNDQFAEPAAAGTKASPEDQEALEYLKANPNSRFAPGISEKLKAKGLL